MKEKINEQKKNFENRLKLINDAINEDVLGDNIFAEIEALRLEYSGKKGSVTRLMGFLREVPNDKKREMGQKVNELKQFVEEKLLNVKETVQRLALEDQIKSAKKIDITLPSGQKFGSLHPVTITGKEVEDVFVSMGFIVEDGPEVVTEFENFEAVNVPKDHPARDMQDTFWLENGQVLKTQTSASQNKILKKYKNKLEQGSDLRVIFPGRCFRNENLDASHENTFFQLEGMMVGENISTANLIYFMKRMLEDVLKKDIEVRLRPGFFPFVEPGFELDVSCPFCGGDGCNVCKKTGWIELCPCGRIHPEVLRLGNIDSKKYNGFAFGLGLTRLAMLKFDLREIRLLNSGNLKFLKQTGTK